MLMEVLQIIQDVRSIRDYLISLCNTVKSKSGSSIFGGLFMKHMCAFLVTLMLVIGITGCNTKDMGEENVNVETRIMPQTSTETSDPQLDEETVDPIAEEPQLQIDDIDEYSNGSSQYSDDSDQIISAEPHKGSAN